MIVVQHLKNFLELREQKLRRKCTRTDLSCLWLGHSFSMTMLARSSRMLYQKLRDYGWEVLPHEPYNPDMSPPDFDLIRKLKELMHWRRFSSLEQLSTEGTRTIRHMNENGILDEIIMFSKRWDSVIEKQGDYWNIVNRQSQRNKGISKISKIWQLKPTFLVTTSDQRLA